MKPAGTDGNRCLIEEKPWKPVDSPRGQATQGWRATAVQGGIAMLVLTRSTGQETLIGDDIRIMVVGVRGDRVRLGITAPESVGVDRAEVYARRMLPGSRLSPTSHHQP